MSGIMRFLIIAAALLLLSSISHTQRSTKFRSRGFDDCREIPDDLLEDSSSSSSEETEVVRGNLYYLVPADVEDPSCDDSVFLEENKAFGKLAAMCEKAREMELNLEEVRVCEAKRGAVNIFIESNNGEDEDGGEEEDAEEENGNSERRRRRRRRLRRREGFTEAELAGFPLQEDSFNEKCGICPEDKEEEESTTLKSEIPP